LETERSRIARDLHDVIGHAVNVMVIHAGAGQGMNGTDSETRAAFETIATTGRAALADLDRMLGLLEGGAERAPLPGIAQLADLGASITGEALSVRVTVDGDPGAVSPGVGVTVYRVAQEALTNVLKHAGATRAQVSVVVADEVTLTVTDDGQGSPHRPGRGLTGIEERVALHGGSVRFGRGPRGGFEVWCRLPRGSTG
ncbi:MAG: histidine kinase, partial [Actinomycetota bacterium]|nr:histidine kinase [Actinomycetota bacterium]